MPDKVSFDDLESTVRFLEKRLILPTIPLISLRPYRAFNSYKWDYLLQGNMTLQNEAGFFTIYFSGTNHSPDPNETLFLDSLLSTVDKTDLVLIEVGRGTTGSCEGDIITDLKREASVSFPLLEDVKPEEFDRPHFFEMTYATNIATSRLTN